MALQPHIVFRWETTRLNVLYWTSKYSYTRTAGILKLIADTGPHAGDPTVNRLWGSSEVGEASIGTKPLSVLTKSLEQNAAALRTTSILHMCSAFENALCGYFSLCSLYQPLMDDSSYTGAVIPDLLKNEAAFGARKRAIKARCDEVLYGKYRKRVELLCRTWRLPPMPAATLGRLDGYYAKRHLIAHDQGLGSADSPDSSAAEIIATSLKIDEQTWKSMIADFDDVLSKLDKSIAARVVLDAGLSLAIHRVIARDGAQTLDTLKGKLADEWRADHLNNNALKSTATSIGLKVSQDGSGMYRVSR
jgi:hypothetical protein